MKTINGAFLYKQNLESVQVDFDLVPAHVQSLDIPSKFQSDSETVDEAQLEQQKIQRQNINQAQVNVAQAASKNDFKYVKNQLSLWAASRALQAKDESNTGNIVRVWALCAFASSYLKVQSEVRDLYPINADIIENWFKQLSHRIVSNYDDIEASKYNNHDFWSAAAVMQVSVITQEKIFFDYGLQGIEWFKSQLQVREDGWLQREVERGSNALNYHQFALSPALLMLRIGFNNGINLFDDLVHQCVAKTANAVNHGNELKNITQYAKATQNLSKVKRKSSLAPFALYRDFGYSKDIEMLLEKEMAYSSLLGGNV